MTVNSSASAEQRLLQEPIGKLFWRYAIPTIASMLVTGVYVTIDGIFIGHVLGDEGLAGLMLAYPVGAILYACWRVVFLPSSAAYSPRKS